MAKILIFDSGVGGLTIFQEINRKLPNRSLIFASDNAAYPYGTKSEKDLVDRVSSVIDALCDKVQPDILVVACNSASTVVLPYLREKLTIPVVGVVPAIKPAAKISETKSIGVLATPATVNRQYTNDLIEQFADGCKVTLLGSSELVDIAEQYIQGVEPRLDELTRIVSPFMDKRIQPEIDTIVLACTHFPLLKKQLDKVFVLNNHQINWIDSGSAIAKRVTELVEKVEKEEVTRQAIFTKKIGMPKMFKEYLHREGIRKIEYLEA